MSSSSWRDHLDQQLQAAGYEPDLKNRSDAALARWESHQAQSDAVGDALSAEALRLFAKRAAFGVRAPSLNTRILAEALPGPLKVLVEFRPAACAVAVILARAAYPLRQVKMTIAALVETTGMARRSVQRALRLLEMAGLVTTNQTKIRRDFNEPNVFWLGDAFEEWFQRPTSASVRQGGDSNDARHKDRNTNNQKYTNYRTQSVSHAPDREQRLDLPEVVEEPSASIRVDRVAVPAVIHEPAEPEDVAPLTTDAPADWEALANKAVAALDPDAKDGNPWLALDRLRRERLKGVQRQFWERAASTHAHRALLAVAEVLLRPMGYFKRGPLAYLAGILRKAVGDCAPERSVARLLAERSGQAYPGGEIALPLGVKPVETITPPDDPVRRRVFEAVGPAAYRSWFEAADIQADGDTVVARLRSAWQANWVLQNYGRILRQNRVSISSAGAL